MEDEELSRKINPSLIIPIEIPNDDPFNNDICLVTDRIPLQLLYSAYLQGVFPWFCEEEGEPVLWFSPDPRFVIMPQTFRIPKSIRKACKNSPFTYTIDTCFEEVIKNCRNMSRKDQPGTWIGPKMIEAYTEFHKAGYAHSIEAWHDGKLAGGFYGILIGSVFCGESMFTLESNSSKTAFVQFAQAFFKNGGKLIDCQCYTDNMSRYGGIEIPRDDFLSVEKPLLNIPLNTNLKDFFLHL